MLELSSPINLDFILPAMDPLGREQVEGKLRFLPDRCELHWALSANVFRGGKGEHAVIVLPYGEIQEVALQRRWLRATRMSFRVNNPVLVREVPGIVMGHMTFEIDKRSQVEVKRLQAYIDFKRSLFLFQQTDAYLQDLTTED